MECFCHFLHVFHHDNNGRIHQCLNCVPAPWSRTFRPRQRHARQSHIEYSIRRNSHWSDLDHIRWHHLRCLLEKTAHFLGWYLWCSTFADVSSHSPERVLADFCEELSLNVPRNSRSPPSYNGLHQAVVQRQGSRTIEPRQFDRWDICHVSSIRLQ